jgi:hypothetical protein
MGFWGPQGILTAIIWLGSVDDTMRRISQPTTMDGLGN